MNTIHLVKEWFNKWESGEYLKLRLSDNFKHTSPFGTIDGKETYLNLVRDNEDKFLGHTFTIHDIIEGDGKACVRYTTNQGTDFSMDVSEWFYIKDDKIDQIFSYYHIGEIREERRLNE